MLFRSRQGELKEQFTSELHQAEQMTEKRKRQLDVASQAGETELQSFIVTELEQYQERGARLEEALINAAKQQLELERKYEEMKHKLKDMHIRQLELMGRENVTRANYRMDQVLNQDPSADKAFTRFGEMETYLDNLEHRVNSDYNRNSIDGRIAQLEKELKSKETLSI